jgi:uncharacterized protein YbaR (Trm112 family)
LAVLQRHPSRSEDGAGLYACTSRTDPDRRLALGRVGRVTGRNLLRMTGDCGLIPTEQRTLEWLEERFSSELNAGELVYRVSTDPHNVTQEHFGGLLRQLRILRWLDRFRFDSLIDVGSGFAFMPWLIRDRYKCETFYCDFVHRWNLPTDLWELHKVDHAVTAKLPQLPFADGAFDAVLCSEVLEHLVHPVEALAELIRIAKRYVIFTSLEALSSGRLRRWIDHHRVDFSVPHVERNFLLLDEFRAIIGDGFHSECFEYPPDMPANPWAPESERKKGYAALHDRETLATALCTAARAREHAPATGFIRKDPTRTPWYLQEPKRPVHQDLAARLRCPDCRQALSRVDAGMTCDACGRSFASEYGVPVLYPRDAELPPAFTEECLGRLCGSDEARRTTVRRVVERLRRNEMNPSGWRRKLSRLL